MKIVEVIKNFKKGQMKIILENNESIIITEEDYFIQSLYEKRDLNEDDLNYLKFNCSKKVAKTIAFKFVALKLRTVFEVKEKLKNAEFTNEVINSVIEDLKRLRYLNDEEYVSRYISNCNNLKPKSNKKIEFELVKKGVRKELILKKIEEAGNDEFEIAYNLSNKRFCKKNYSKEVLKKKIFYFLANRGFEYSIIKAVYEKILKMNGID